MCCFRFLLVGFALLMGSTAIAARPNVLFIGIDDLNDYVGCLGGHPNALTPNIDRLASQGTVFTNAHCQAPICGPSRASLFCGLRPSTTGIYGQIRDTGLRDASKVTQEATFLPDYLEQQGYHTAGSGKMFHNGDRAKYFDEYGKGTNFGPKPKKRFAYDPAWFPDRSGSTQTDWGVFPGEDENMPDHDTAEWVIDWLRQRQETTSPAPFFLAAGFVRPHVPWYTSQKWFDAHPVDQLSMPAYLADDWDDLPPISIAVNEAPMMPSMKWVNENQMLPAIVQSYLACTTFVDNQVGRVLEALRASPYAETTYIVLWSDHGYHVGEKGRFAKQSLWERSSRVPLIIVGPGLPAGQRCDRPVELLDLYPTLLELLNLPPNAKHEGLSLVPLLLDSAAERSRPAITTYGPGNHAIQDERYRLIVYEDGSRELYDHEQDPHEWHNLIAEGKPGLPAMESRLRGFVPKVNAPNAKGSSYNFNAYFRRVLAN